MVARLGLLVAGGRGARMGEGLPKALRTVGGRTLFARAEAVLRACCDEVLVCAPVDLELPCPRDRRVPDAPAGEAGSASASAAVFAAGGREGSNRSHGPLAGIVAGLAAREYGAALVLGVDFPLLDAATLRTVERALDGRAVALAAPGGVPQPLAAWYAPGAAAPLAEAFARGERSVTRAVLALPHALVPVDGERFLNVNTPDDLVRAELLLERLPS
ncbi:MAG: molybdenum cofactor guanylyltransferase [Candidatus Eisenbacteria bacterium]|uniref:Molybdenum cofactor guanylyltransferase n=1 Tax=Eiseniibacteriota bacterium TaxID=2212470 RepID=A0A933W3P8_UNCEI|nr:molybdenum cofactor guanylyltransferase [Candidatus Eisenbacteria bacterium]